MCWFANENGEAPIEFPQLTINVTVLEPGQSDVYHAEANQEHYPVRSYSRLMGPRVALTVRATAAVVGLLGCGGAGKHTRTTPVTSFTSHCDNCGVSLHSPNHHYSARQVEAAFASHDVHLHKDARQVMPGFVVLRYGRCPHFIAVAVRTGRMSPGLQYYDAGSAGERFTRHGNVFAIYDSGRSAAVMSVLAELH